MPVGGAPETLRKLRLFRPTVTAICQLSSGHGWSGSSAKKPHHQRKDQADDDHRGDRKVEPEARSVDDNIAGQSPQGYLSQPGPEEPYNKHNDPDNDQRSLHGVKTTATCCEKNNLINKVLWQDNAYAILQQSCKTTVSIFG